MGPRVARLVVPLGPAASLIAASTATAGTLSVTDVQNPHDKFNFNPKGFVTQELRYQGAPGERNDLRVVQGGSGFAVTDAAGVSAGRRCRGRPR